MPNATSIAERIRSGLDEFSSSEKLVARYILSGFPCSGLDTVERIAEASGVSSATVVRFVQSLGIPKFKLFQDQLKQELIDRQQSALDQAAERSPVPAQGTNHGVFSDQERAFVEGIHSTFENLRAADITSAVDLLSNQNKHIIGDGGTYSHILAEHMLAQLNLFRTNLHSCPADGWKLEDTLTSISTDTVWVTFDFRRYSATSAERARTAKARGAILILITDKWMSPIASYADIVLTARVEANGPSDTLVSALALVEGICEAVADQLGSEGMRRLADIDPIRRSQLS
ncbi:MurR/RpiR family transcriptional regulator [Corynebacterium confusum]|uniref:MurR/RpiR family transcriptional regulator n=1 Tax=uncultured Corynebacterium sp. TaxID=159447 RepID=UPI0025F04554|nr:MurR/RpiR family transcriptional regulator [uncultured Corynebacterium sp.]